MSRLLFFPRVSWVSLAGCGAGEEEVAFAGVAGKGGAFELGAGLGEARESGDDARGLDAPDGFDGAVCGVMWIGSGHCHRSHQVSIHGCKRGYSLAV